MSLTPLRKYVRMLSIFYKNTLIGEMEYRLNFLVNLGASLFWLVWAALSVRVYFFHTGQIAGWTYPEMLVVMGLFFAMNGYRQMLISPNLRRLSEYVRLGTLDYILTKPVDSQFLVSLRRLGVYNWGDPLLGLGLVVYGLALQNHTPTLPEVVMFVLLAAAGMLILYSFTLALQTTTFWLVNIERADGIVTGFLETGRFPVNFYKGWVRAVLTALIPVAFMTTFPAQALLGRIQWGTAAIAIGLALLAVVLSSAFWRYALRYYTGASS